MNRTNCNSVVDAAAFAALGLLIATGTLLRFVLPPGSHGDMLLGLTRHQWGAIHFWIAAAFVAAILTHLLLHVAWIKNVFCKTAGRRITIIVLTAFLAIATAIQFIVPVQQDAVRERHGAPQQGMRANNRANSAP